MAATSATQTAYDVERIRQHFPGLKRQHGNRPAIFFDNPGGTQIAQEAIDRMMEAMTVSNANVGGKFETSIEAVELLRQGHAAAADFVGAADPGECIFGQSMTALTFAISRSLGREFKAGDEIVLTRMDHDGNVTPWMMLAEDRGLVVRWLDFDPQTFEYDLSSLDKLFGPKTRLIAVNYASNVTGTINDVKTIARAAKAAGALVYADAVQAAPHVALDVQGLGCDFLVCSAYKFYGPHYGLLWGRRELLERLTAYKVRACSPALPGKWESGTLSREAVAGTHGAIEYIGWIGKEFGGANGNATRRARVLAGMEAMRRHDHELAVRLIEGLRPIPKLRIQGLTAADSLGRRVPTVSFDLEGHNPADIATFLGKQGIHVWHGHNYGVEPVTRLGLLEKGGVLRVGPTHYNTLEEVDSFLTAMREYVKA